MLQKMPDTCLAFLLANRAAIDEKIQACRPAGKRLQKQGNAVAQKKSFHERNGWRKRNKKEKGREKRRINGKGTSASGWKEEKEKKGKGVLLPQARKRKRKRKGRACSCLRPERGKEK